MPALNVTIILPKDPPFSNTVFSTGTRSSVDWFHNQYTLYLVRIVALGGCVLAIRQIIRRYRCQGRTPKVRAAEGTFYHMIE